MAARKSVQPRTLSIPKRILKMPADPRKPDSCSDQIGYLAMVNDLAAKLFALASLKKAFRENLDYPEPTDADLRESLEQGDWAATRNIAINILDLGDKQWAWRPNSLVHIAWPGDHEPTAVDWAVWDYVARWLNHLLATAHDFLQGTEDKLPTRAQIIALADAAKAFQMAFPAIASADGRGGQAPKRRIVVDLAKKTITFDDATYDVDSDQALRWVQVLASHLGEWISGPDLEKYDPNLIGVRTDKLQLYLPKAILNLIESQPGKGSRLRVA